MEITTRNYSYLYAYAQTITTKPARYGTSTLNAGFGMCAVSQYMPSFKTATTTAHEPVFSNISTILHNGAENEVRFRAFLQLLVTETGNDK
jgi:hypothetical protein